MGRGRFAAALACASIALGACFVPYSGEDEIRAIERTDPHEGSPGDGASADGGATVDPPEADAESPIDAAKDAPPPRCDRSKPFGAPVFVDSVNSADFDADARLTADEKTLYFTSERGTVPPSKRHRMWTATRVGDAFEFSNLTLAFDYVNAEVYDPTVSPDGLTLVVQHTATGTGSANLETATRLSTGAAFGPFAAIPALDAPAATERDPYFAADGSLLFTQDGKIMRARRSGTVWTAAIAPETSALSSVRNPVMSADGREIFFSSEAGTPGKLRIHRATRASTTAKFGAASPVKELGGTNAYEAPTWLSADGCHLLLTSDRGGGLDVYYAIRGK